MVRQKEDESIEEIDREELFKYIETKEFLAVVFCKYIFIRLRLKSEALPFVVLQRFLCT